MVFQDHALWPHLSVLDTVAYPLRRAGAPKSAARRAARDILEQMGLGPLAERRPGQLSGGEQQRVGLARALAGGPGIYLFDEPTAHLDASLRARSWRRWPAAARPTAPRPSTPPTTRPRRWPSPTGWPCCTRAGWPRAARPPRSTPHPMT